MAQDTDNITIAIMGDSPDIHTGFAVPVKEALKACCAEGWNIHVLAFMDPDRRDLKERNNPVVGEIEGHPYTKYHSFMFDDLWHQNWDKFLRFIKPDVVFIVTDPGNLYKYLYGMKHSKIKRKMPDGRWFTPPVVSYTPVENTPIPYHHRDAWELVQWLGGVPIVYCDTAAKMIRDQFPNIMPKVARHGSDHADFKKYSDEDRRMLRRMVGLDGRFVVGCVAVNKRTKGLDKIIYTARELKDMGKADNILFYLHTNPTESTMFGYPLDEMIEYYDVADMVIFKQIVEGSWYWMGSDRDNDTLEQVRILGDQIPEDPEVRGFLWMHYDFIAKLNCFDAYIDLSQVEGWSLPNTEAMACGVPVIGVKDHGVRDEIFAGARLEIEPLPRRLWNTTQSSARLVDCDPREAALKILELKDDEALQARLSNAGLECARRYSWKDYQKIVIDTIKETVRLDREMMRKPVDLPETDLSLNLDSFPESEGVRV